MFCIGQEFTTSRSGSELGHLGEVEVKSQVITFVADREDHISSLIAGSLTEFKCLTIDLDFWVLSTRHHLNFQIWVLNSNFMVFIEAHNGK